MYRIFLTLMLMLCSSYVLFSQIGNSDEPLVTDRPDLTESSTIVPHKSLQVEAGINGEGFKDDTLDIQSTSYVALLRYGLFPNMELRMEIGMEDFNENREQTSIQGLSPLVVGAKIGIAEESGWRPEISFIGHTTLQWFGEEAFRPEDVEPDFRFAFGHTLSDKMGLSYNLGMQWEGAEESGIYTIALGYGFTDRFGGFIEQFGTFQSEFEYEGGADAGFTYLVNDNLQLDIAAGIPLTDNAPDYIFTAGFSWRIQK